MTTTPSTLPRPLAPQVAVITLFRGVANTVFRMVYPLLPVLARGVGVEIGAMALIVTGMSLLGLSAPFTALISERYGKRVTMMIGLVFNGLGLMVVFLVPGYLGLALALWSATLAKFAYDPASHAYVGDRVDYAQRGRVMGLMELSWSGAFIMGVPIATWLIAQGNWRTPFAVFGLLSIVGAVFLFLIVDADVPAQRTRTNFWGSLHTAVNTRMAVAGLVLGFGISAANQLVAVVFGVWIEEAFGVALAALAAAALVIGSSELLGEGVVAAFADRIGKRRLVALGIAFNIAAALLLPFTGVTLTVALIGLFLFYLSFEVALVATLPLATAISAGDRAVYLTVLVAAITLGRALMTPLAPLLFSYGLIANTVLAVLMNVTALIAVWGFIRVD